MNHDTPSFFFFLLFLFFFSFCIFAQDNPAQNLEDYQLALKYRDQNDPRAIQLFQNSASTGNSDAHFMLGQLYELGDLTSQNLTRAFQEYRASADLRNAAALRKIGYFYDTEKGVAENRALAYLHYSFATLAQDQEASIILAYKHFYGFGVPQSCETSAAYYHQIATNLIESIPKGYGMIFLLDHPRLVEYESTRDRKSERRDIVMYYKYKADSGDPYAQVAIGNLYLQGAYGVEQNYEQALYYFNLAANQGDAAGYCNVGYMYSFGLGVEQNNETAVRYYKLAINKGNAHAQNILGQMLLTGDGIEKDFPLGLKYIIESAKRNHPESIARLGLLYLKGVKPDVKNAIAYLRASAASGNLLAMYHLATLYLSEKGASRSCSTAVRLLKKYVEKLCTENILDEAYLAFEAGEISKSLLLYEQAAEMGVEIAQSNAAFFYERGLAPVEFYGGNQTRRFKQAFRYYSMSSQQFSGSSHLKLGDFYFYGAGDLQPDFKKSVYHIRQGAELKNAQASFNLGYMYQHGLGTQKDFFLAKRHYDLAVEFNSDAIAPVNLALLWLWIQSCYESLSQSFGFLDIETAGLLTIFLGLVVTILARRTLT